MAIDAALNVFIGYDSREAVATEVAAHSIRRKTRTNTSIYYLNHINLRKQNHFTRPWLIDGKTGITIDIIDGRPFTTEYTYTRFLIPILMRMKGWALYVDGDTIFLSDVKKLFELVDDKYAVMCVKHNQQSVPNISHLNGRLKNQYYRKNWSSLMLINCEHPSNKKLTKEYVNLTSGADLHAFSWLESFEIGDISQDYNYISGISKPLSRDASGKVILPKSIHYTEGGPWNNDGDIQFAELWINEYEEWCRDADHGKKINDVPKTTYDRTI